MALLVTEIVCHCWLLSLYVTAGYRACMSLLVTEFVFRCRLPGFVLLLVTELVTTGY